MSAWWKSGVAGVAIFGGVVAATVFAAAQMPPGPQGMQGQMPGGMQGQMPGGMQGQMPGGMQGQMPGGMQGQMPGGMQGQMRERMQGQMHEGMHGRMHEGHGRMMGQPGDMSAQPEMPGQDAFGAIQEIVETLQADPATDWTKVNISALREHLIDMNEVTLHAVAEQHAVDNGVEITVTGEGRTLAAIKRMVPAHISELARSGWSARTEDLPNGVKLIVASADPAQVTKLKALGFMGIMVQGDHHQMHHLAMAKGQMENH
ncbi:hypothetical protein ASC80_00695 [Afipia sp. Root123D2]|uniref:hypothetical protein n=1 Tax=Afipia sp. Root123D2 TaxID=1736436 RepID=UPI0006F71BE1|nr:hypothetical protein [Afipia sp. Root123D2]KQW21962.1 hypothetical protein ASC80_00695 [Afipia sp. Root123D2]